MKRISIAGVLASVLAASLACGPISFAQTTTTDPGFDPNFVLSDDDLFNPDGMTYDRLVYFLRSKGTLADTRVADTDGTPKLVPEIIWRVSRSYAMNPKYLVALIQKEQSLVEDSNPSKDQFDWAAGYGVCDSCSKSDPSIQEYKGFASQLEWAAKQHREKYLFQLLSKGLTIGGQGAGKTVQIDGQSITPTNRATAMLYSYTPHIAGNYNLWRIWKRWFSVPYPDGTVVRATPSGKAYQLRFGEKRPFSSNAVLASRFDLSKIVTVKDADIANYSLGPMIKFAPYALLRTPNGTIYLLTDDAKRRIANMKAFDKFGFNIDEVEDVSDADVTAFPNGAAITTQTQFPQGVLMRVASNSGVWYIEDGTRHALLDASLLRLYFNGRRVQTVKQASLDHYAVGDPYKLHDGELVKAKDGSTVYVVEQGRLRAIPSEDVFNAVGWNWKNVVTVPSKLILAHEVGDPFSPTTSPVQSL